MVELTVLRQLPSSAVLDVRPGPDDTDEVGGRVEAVETREIEG